MEKRSRLAYNKRNEGLAEDGELILFYFSGTGNSKYMAEYFCREMDAECRSIEETADFDALIAANDVVAFCYPIYGSCVPRPMREFVTAHADALQAKKLIIFCTQLLFSGDGARALTDLMPGSTNRVICAEHFDMPNNVCNFWMLSVKNGAQNEKKLRAAEKKMRAACENIQAGVVKRRGFNWFSRLLGMSQNLFWPKMEETCRSSIRVDSDCIRCGLCVERCPAKNLSLGENGIVQHDNCYICYRCVNLCPKQAITVMLHAKPKAQYRGVSLGEGRKSD